MGWKCSEWKALTQRGREDLNHEDLDEERAVLRVGEGAAAAADADAYAAREVAQPAADTRPEDGVAAREAGAAGKGRV